MAVGLINSAQIRSGTANTFTAGAGSNRLLVAVAPSEASTASYASNLAPTFGGVALTPIGSDPFIEHGNPDRLIGGYYLKHALIPSGEQTYAQTETDLGGWTGTVYTFSGVNQTTPIADFVEEEQASAATWTTSSIIAPDNSIVVVATVNANSFSGSSDITTADYVDDHKTANFSSMASYTAHKVVATGGAESCSFDWAGNNEVGANLIFALNPAPGESVILQAYHHFHRNLS